MTGGGRHENLASLWNRALYEPGDDRNIQSAARAKEVKKIIEQLIKQLDSDVEAGLLDIGEGTDRFTDGMLDLLMNVKVHHIGPSEVEQLGYEFKIEDAGQPDNQIVITTEEADISALLKILVVKGAKVEFYSAHDYPETGYGR